MPGSGTIDGDANYAGTVQAGRLVGGCLLVYRDFAMCS
jgi:hypothetical protein